MSRDSILDAHSSLIVEEIKFQPCIWNVGGEADFLFRRLSRVLTAGIDERGFCFEIRRGQVVLFR